MSKLRIRNGPYAGRERNLAEDAVTIGRDVEAGIQILDRSASRFHAEVFPVGGMYFVRDLESKNGTYINGELLEDEELLRENDVIKIGTSELIFETGAALNEEDTNDRLAYSDDAELLSHTLEYRVDDLSDIQDEEEVEEQRRDDSRALQMLYQVGKLTSAATDGDVAARVLDYMLLTMPADNAIAFLRDRESGKLLPHTVRSADDNSPVICRTLIRRAMMENRAVLTANAQEDVRLERRESAVIKGIGSVMCVPLGIGQARGVIYLARRAGRDPFVQRDLEILSGCAVPLGLAFQAIEQRRRHQEALWSALLAMVRVMEERLGRLGAGERCARTASGLGRALGLAEVSCERLRLAGLLHHLGSLAGKNPGADIQHELAHLAEIEDFDDIVPLIRGCQQGRRTSDADPEHDVEIRVLTVAATFVGAIGDNPDQDAVQLIDQLARTDTLDTEIVEALRTSHLEGTLYGERRLPTAAGAQPVTASISRAGGAGSSAKVGLRPQPKG